MSELKCPFCGEPRLRFSCGVNRFACGTVGPYLNDGEGEYETGHTCDIHTYSRLFKEMEQRLAAAEAALQPFAKVAVDIDPKLEDYMAHHYDHFVGHYRAAAEAAKGGRDGTPEGLQTELLKCPRPVLVWVLELVQRLAATEAERIWTCGCGTVNGVNLETCRVCGRREGEGRAR